MAEREIKVEQPKPAYVSMPGAVSAFIKAGCDRTAMNVLAWADTFKCAPDEIRQTWERLMSAHSLQPQNTCEVPEGK